MRQEQKDDLQILFDSSISEIELSDYIDEDQWEQIKTAEDLFWALDDKHAFDIEIIYYHKAMKYLMENDPSLTESLELAEDYGFTAENLNSERLASLHASSKAQENFWEYGKEIREILNNCLIKK